MVNLCEPFKNCLLVPYIAYGFCGCKLHWLSKLDVLGSISQVKALPIAVPDVGSKSFTPKGEAGSCGFPLNCLFSYWEWG